MSPLWPTTGALWPAADRLGVGGVPNGEEVVVKRRPMIRKPGSTQLSPGSWEQAEEHTVSGVGLDRTVSSTLVADSGDDEQLTSTIWGPTQADIQRGDRVVFPSSGIEVLVTGIPNRQPNMINGWQPPMSVSAKVTNG